MLNNRFKLAEERINKNEGVSIQTIQSEEKKEKWGRNIKKKKMNRASVTYEAPPRTPKVTEAAEERRERNWQKKKKKSNNGWNCLN